LPASIWSYGNERARCIKPSSGAYSDKQTTIATIESENMWGGVRKKRKEKGEGAAKAKEAVECNRGGRKAEKKSR
jgi:hypothetical protein